MFGGLTAGNPPARTASLWLASSGGLAAVEEPKRAGANAGPHGWWGSAQDVLTGIVRASDLASSGLRTEIVRTPFANFASTESGSTSKENRKAR